MKSSERINEAIKEIIMAVEDESKEIASDAVLSKLSDVEQAIKEEGKTLSDAFNEISITVKDGNDIESDLIVSKLSDVEQAIKDKGNATRKAIQQNTDAIWSEGKMRRIEFAIERLENEMKNNVRGLVSLRTCSYQGRDVMMLREILYAFRIGNGYHFSCEDEEVLQDMQRELHTLLGAPPRLSGTITLEDGTVNSWIFYS